MFFVCFDAMAPLTKTLDAVRFILAEYGLVAKHSAPAHAYFVVVWFSRNAKFDVRKYIRSHTLDTVHLFLHKIRLMLKSMILLLQ